MNYTKELESLPNVEIADVFTSVISEPQVFIKENEDLFASTYQPLAQYNIYKGEYKGQSIILYMNACIDGTEKQHEPYYGVRVTGDIGEDETFETLKDSIKRFKRVLWEHENKSVYRVYQAKLKDEDERILFSLSETREISFRKEVEEGRFLIELDTMVLIKETEDRNEAKSMATEF